MFGLKLGSSRMVQRREQQALLRLVRHQRSPVQGMYLTILEWATGTSLSPTLANHRSLPNRHLFKRKAKFINKLPKQNRYTYLR